MGASSDKEVTFQPDSDPETSMRTERAQMTLPPSSSAEISAEDDTRHETIISIEDEKDIEITTDYSEYFSDISHVFFTVISKSTFLKILLILATSIVLLGPGLIFYFMYDHQQYLGYPVYIYLIIPAIFISGFPVVNLILDLLLYICSFYRLFTNWGGLYYISELSKFTSALIWIIIYFFLWNYKIYGHLNVFWQEALEEERRMIETNQGHKNVWDLNEIHYLKARALLCFFLFILGYAIKYHYVQKVAMSFNFSNYLDRVKDCLFAQSTLFNLGKARYVYKAKRRLKKSKRFQDEDETLTAKIMRRFKAKNTGHKRTVSVPNETAKETEDQVPQEREIPDFFDITESSDAKTFSLSGLISSDKDEKSMSALEKQELFTKFFQLSSKTLAQFMVESGNNDEEVDKQARKLAHQLFKWSKNASDVVPVGSLRVFFSSTQDFEKSCSLLKPTPETRELTEHDFFEMIQQTYRERIGLTKSIHDMNSAVSKLDKVFTALLVLLIGIIFCAILFEKGIETIGALSGLIFGAGFMFQSSAKNAFESIVFLFVIHPFDVGDRVHIDLNGNQNLVVSELNLMSTTFERWDGVKIYLANFILANKGIINIRRSGHIGEVVEFQIAFETSPEKLNQFKHQFREFLAENSTDYTDCCMFYVDVIQDLNKINMGVYFEHRKGLQNYEAQLGRKSRVLMKIKEIVSSLGIQYYKLPQKIQIVEENK